MDVLVPFDATDPNSRLAPVLDADERAALARAMLRDVSQALQTTAAQPTVLSTAAVECDVPVVVDERPLTDAVNARLAATSEPLAVVMADLALATPAALAGLFQTEGDVVLAPGRGGGTNALVARHPAFRVDYHGASIRDHRAMAHELGGSVSEVDSFRLSSDIDTPEDLPEVLLHTDGRAAAWLQATGFEVATGDGRVTVTR
jgi:2-phospho-L-lactate guanylyltransferase